MVTENPVFSLEGSQVIPKRDWIISPLTERDGRTNMARIIKTHVVPSNKQLTLCDSIGEPF